MKLERGLSDNTVASYRSDLKKIGAWAESKAIKPLALTAQDIKDYLDHLHGEGITARSQSRALSTLVHGNWYWVATTQSKTVKVISNGS